MNPRFFIFGDSHAGTLLRAARGMSLDFAGGSVMAGMYMNDTFFKVKDGRFVMLSKMGKERLAKRLEDSGLGPNLLDLDMPVLSTVGFNTTNFESHFRSENLAIANSPGERFISSACFEAVVEGARRGALEFYRTLRQAGKSVYAVLSPQRFTENQKAVCTRFETVMTRRLAELGVEIVDVRAETTDSDGTMLSQFASTSDRVHANNAFGEVVLDKFLEMHGRIASSHAPLGFAGPHATRQAAPAHRTSRARAPRPRR